MNNLKKRCLTLLLSLAMIVTYMPTSLIAYAEAEGETDQVQVEQQVDAEEPAAEVTSEDAAPEEVKTEDVKSEEAASEEKAKDAASPEKESSEEAGKPTDEKTKEDADAKAEESEKEFAGGDLEAKSTHYKVNISYDADAAIPEGSTLEITEFPEGSAKYEEAKKELLKDELGNSPFSDFDENATDEDLEGLGMAAFDLTIRDKDGNPVEPAKDAKVQVNVEVVELPEGADAQTLADSMEIQHLNESSGDVVVEKVATVDSKEASQVKEVGEIDVNTNSETAAVEFTVDGFSTYTMTWDYGGSQSITVHYVDTEGNSVTPTITPTFTNNNMFLIYDVEGYEYDSTHYGSLTGTSITPLVRQETWRHDRQYYNNGWQDLENDIYVVYKTKTAPTEGGTAKPIGDQTWPEEKPTFSKSSKNNADGTNTISLTIKGAEKAVENGSKANVIVVFDVSGSMGGNNSWRLETAQEAVDDMADVLLNKKDPQGNKLVKMALVTFSTSAKIAQGFTSDPDTIKNTVDNLEAAGGTNWEKALRLANTMPVDSDAATFVVFVTDGDPTFRVSRGDVSDGDLDMYSSSTYQYYRSDNVFGEGDDDSDGRNFDFASEEVQSIVANNKTFYAIGISNDVQKVQTLCTESGVPADNAFLATDASALEEAFEKITHSISATLGFAEVKIHDGVTSMTRVMQNVDTGSFKYYRYGGKNNKYGADYAHKQEWTTREADGCNAAEYKDGAIEWNMGSDFQLEDGVTYIVEATAWPKQEAYDLVADLNNGLKSYESLTQEEKDQVHVEDDGSYTLKTNTNNVKATYKESITSGSSTTVKEEVFEADKTEVSQGMLLPSESMTIRKAFAHSINSQDPFTSIEFYLKIDGKYYQKDGTTSSTLDENKVVKIPVNTTNEWKNHIYIAPGFMEGEEVLETGHKYTLEEKVIVGSEYEYEFTPQTVRPMIIDGVLVYLVLVDKYNAPGKNGVPASAKTYTIDGEQYYVVSESDGELVGTNRKTAELDITKIVNGGNSNKSAEELAEETFTYRVTLQVPDGTDPAGIVGYEYVYRPTQDNAFYLYGYHQYEGGTPAATAFDEDIERLGNNKYRAWNTLVYADLVEFDKVTVAGKERIVSRRDADGNIIWKVPAVDGFHTITYDMTLKQNEVIRFTNLPSGTKYTIQEIYANKYPADNVGGDTSGRAPVSDPSNIAAEGYTISNVQTTAGKVSQTAVQKDTVSGTIEDLNIRYYNQFTNALSAADAEINVTKAIEGYDWADGDAEYKFTITPVEDDAPAPENAELTISGAADKEHTVSSGRIRFTEAGTYSYTVKETAGGNDAIIYDDSEKTITFTVTNNNGKLSVTPSSADAEFTNKWAKTSKSVEKVWADEGIVDKLKIKEVSVKLQQLAINAATGKEEWVDVEGKTTALNEGNKWKASFDDLPKYATDGSGAVSEIAYRIVETAVTSESGDNITDLFDTTYTEANDKTTITNTKETTTVKVVKTWDDNNDQDGKRKDVNATVQLYRKVGTSTTEEPVGAAVAVGTEDGWEHEWTDLPVKDQDSVDPENAEPTIQYTVKESPLTGSGYSTKYTAVYKTAVKDRTETFEITNSYAPEKHKITVTKVWDDASNQDGKRPSSVAFTVTGSNGKTYPVSVTGPESGAADTWTAEVEVDKYTAGGTPVTFTVDETVPEGYTKTKVDNDTLTITNSYTPEKDKITVKKIWDDASDQDGKRPDDVTFTVTGSDGKTYEATLSGNGDTWTQEVEVDKYQKGGQAVTFTVDEEAVTGYDKEIDDENLTITNSYTPEKDKITVTKIWDDASDQDGKRPKNVKFTVTGSDGKTYEATLSGDGDTWTQEVEVDKYQKGGQAVTFTVDEELVEKYEKKIDNDTLTITNSYAPEIEKIEVTKIWDDASDQDGKRPDDVKFTVTGSDGKTYEATLSGNGDTWKQEVEVNKYTAGGKEVTFTVDEEDVANYDKSIDNSKLTITNSYKPEKDKITVTKIWDDASDQDGKRPKNVKFTVTGSDGKTYEATLSGNGDTWTQEVEVDKYHDSGTVVTFEVDEEAVTGYDKEIDNENLTITNSYAPEKDTITVTKIWDDASNQDGKRPSSVAFTVTGSNGKTYPVSVTGPESGAADTWTAEVEVDKYTAGGTPVTFTVDETVPEGYTKTKVDNDTLTITNSYTPEKDKITVTKIWEDASNQDGKRPDDVTFTVTGSDGKTYEATLADPETGAEDTWTAEVEVDKYTAGGKVVTFTVDEEDVANYNKSIDNSKLTITNSYEPETTKVTATKTWNDASDQDGKRASVGATVQLYKTVKGTKSPVGDSVKVAATDGTIKEWTGLPVYEGGNQITYSVEETLPADSEYQKSGDNVTLPAVKDDSGTVAITNSYTPETTDIDGVKTWNDNEYQDLPDSAGYERPESIKVTLTGEITVDGKTSTVSTDTKVVTAENNWSYSWTDLPVYNAGSVIDYKVTEELPESYTYVNDEEDPFSLINTPVEKNLIIDPISILKLDSVTGQPIPGTIFTAKDAEGNVVGTTTTTADGAGSITFTEEGTYTLTETAPVGYTSNPGSWSITVSKSGVDKVEYDPAEGVWNWFYHLIFGDDSQYKDGVLTVPNTPVNTKVVVTKKWNDNDNKDGVRPESIELTLNGKAGNWSMTPQTVTVKPDKDGNWSYTWDKDIVGYHNGERIIYSVTEKKLDDYTTSYSEVTGKPDANGYAVTVTNSHQSEPEKEVYVGTSTTFIDGAEAQPGDTLTYKITYTNTSGSTATATVTDTIPAHTTYVNGSADNGGTFADGKVTWTLTDVPDGGSKTVSFKVTVNEDVNGAVLKNTGVINVGDNEYSTNEVTTPTPSDPVKDVFDSKDPENSINGDKVIAGQELLYKITYKNTTGKDVSATITDEIPANSTYVSGSADNKGVEKDGVVTWNVDVPKDGSVTVSFKVTVNEDNGVSVDNDAVVQVGENKYNTNETTNPTGKEPEKEVYVGTSTTFIDGAEAQPGDTLTYKIKYENTTGADVTATITDSIPAHTKYVAGSADNKGVEKDGVITWKIDVPKDGNVTVSFQVTVDEDVDGAELKNTSKVNDGANDYDSNEVTTPTPSDPVKDVFDSKDPENSIDGNKVIAGQELLYKITYKNTTGKTATATITDEIPANSTYVDGSADHDGSFAGGKVTWTLKDVENGGEVTVSFKVTVNEDNGVSVDNDAVVQVGENKYNTNETTNPTGKDPEKEVYVGKSTTFIDGAEAQPGDTLTYKIKYENTTGADVTATITDSIPAHTKYVDGSADNKGVEKDGVITWKIDVPKDGNVTVSFQVTVDEDVDGALLKNTSKVNDGANDYDSNEVTTPTPSDPVKDVFDSKDPENSIDGNKVIAGQELLYKITYKNTTGKTATATITDEIPANSTYVDGSADHDGSFADGKLTWTLKDVENGGEVTVSFKVTVNENNGVSVDNDAVVQVGENKYNTNETTNPTGKNPEKEVYVGTSTTFIDGAEAQPGDTLTYKIKYENTTGADVTATITDSIPAHTKYVDGSADNKGVEKDGVITWKIDVPKDGNVTVSFQVTVDEDVDGALLKNTSKVNDGANDYDSNEVTTPTPSDPVKDVFKNGSTTSIDGKTVYAKDELLYKITYKNTTGKTVTATITDEIPANSTYVDGSADHDGSFADGKLTWTLKDVENGGEVTVSFKVTVNENNGVSVDNDAVVQVGENKYNTNETSNPVPSDPTKDVFTSKVTTSIDGKEVKIGEELTYKINYKNTTAEDVTAAITDTIPAHTEYVKDSADNGGTFADGKVTWSLPVKKGEEVTVSFKVKVKDDVNGDVLKNKAVVNDGVNDYETNETKNPTPRQLTIKKNLADYVDNGEAVKVTFAFEIKGKYADGSDYTNTIGMEFTKASDAEQTVVVKGIPNEVTGLTVEEVYTGNYKPAEVGKVKVEDKDGMYQVSFNNTKQTHNYEGGAVNHYAKNDGKYKYQPGTAENGTEH